MEKSTKENNRLESWIEKIWPRIYRFFYYKMQNREEAEELTQETLDKICHKLKTGNINEKEKAEAYTFVTARNLLTDLWRKRARQISTISMDELHDKGWDPPQHFQEAEEKMIVQQAMSKLSPDHRKVLTLRIIEGWPVRNVAKKMRRSQGAIRSLQFRAVQALKEILEKEGFFNV